MIEKRASARKDDAYGRVLRREGVYIFGEGEDIPGVCFVQAIYEDDQIFEGFGFPLIVSPGQLFIDGVNVFIFDGEEQRLDLLRGVE